MPDGPGSLSWRGYPLAVGNRWDFRFRTRTVVVTDQGPQSPTAFEGTFRTEVAGTQRVGDHDYFVLDNLFSAIDGSVWGQAFMRSDPGGLYQLQPFIRVESATREAEPATASALARELEAGVDGALAGSPARAAFIRAARLLATRVAALRTGTPGTAAGPGADEYALLRYPLRSGARWEVQTGVARTVEGLELVSVPAGAFLAWRVRTDSDVLGTAYSVRSWYAGAGLVKATLNAEVLAYDDSGNPIGRLVLDQDQRLTGVRLVPWNGAGTLAPPSAPPTGSE